VRAPKARTPTSPAAPNAPAPMPRRLAFRLISAFGELHLLARQLAALLGEVFDQLRNRPVISVLTCHIRHPDLLLELLGCAYPLKGRKNGAPVSRSVPPPKPAVPIGAAAF
jgi:hypothetical protein